VAATTVKREEKVMAHRRRNSDRIVREESHHERRDAACETGGNQHGAEVHPRRAQHGWLNEDDVRHRQERRDAGDELGADGCAVFRQTEEAFDHVLKF
jgi:hypothetical protein